MYQWAVTCLRTSGGLYNDHINADGSVNSTIWSYNQGVMVGAGVLLNKLTGASAYLSQAEQTASAALLYFGTGPNLINQGPAFNGIYFRNLLFLNSFVPNDGYASEAQSFGSSYCGRNRQMSSELIDPQYGVELNRFHGRDVLVSRREPPQTLDPGQDCIATTDVSEWAIFNPREPQQVDVWRRRRPREECVRSTGCTRSSAQPPSPWLEPMLHHQSQESDERCLVHQAAAPMPTSRRTLDLRHRALTNRSRPTASRC